MPRSGPSRSSKVDLPNFLLSLKSSWQKGPRTNCFNERLKNCARIKGLERILILPPTGVPMVSKETINPRLRYAGPLTLHNVRKPYTSSMNGALRRPPKWQTSRCPIWKGGGRLAQAERRAQAVQFSVPRTRKTPPRFPPPAEIRSQGCIGASFDQES